MSGPSQELREFVVQRLIAAVPDVGGRVFSNPPDDAEEPYISLGGTYFHPDDYDGIAAREQTLPIDIWSASLAGPVECERLCDQVKSVLHDHHGDLGAHALADLKVELVRTLAEPTGGFHGVVQIVALIEERT